VSQRSLFGDAALAGGDGAGGPRSEGAAGPLADAVSAEPRAGSPLPLGEPGEGPPAPLAGAATEAASPPGAEPQADAIQQGAPARARPFRYWETPVPNGRTLVEASAGTGKTFALAGLVLRFVLDGDRLARGPGGLPDLRRLLVVTFTVAATEELKTRIRAALRTALTVARGAAEPDDLTRPLAPLLARADAEARLLAALDVVDEAGVLTIHGFCQRVLKQAAFESGTPFDLELTEETGPLEARAAADAWAALTHGQPWLAALAVRRGWTPRDLVEHHKRATTFPDTTIVPAAPPLADALDALRQRAADLAGAWDERAVRDLLDGLVWRKGAPLGDPEALGQAAARVAAVARDPDALDAAGLFTVDALKDALYSNRTVNKDRMPQIEASGLFARCAAVGAAVETLRLSLIHAFSETAGERLDAIKERRGVLGFDDLLRRLHGALHAPETGPALVASVQRLFGVALVDEFQDTDPVQYAIFKAAFEGAPLVFVGDPKQAIYGFRGADIHAYLGAQAEADGRYTLTTNWRSARGVVDATNALFARARRPFLYRDIAFHPAAANRLEPRIEGDGRAPVVWWTAEADGKPIPKGDARAMCVRATVGEVVRLLSGDVTVEGRALRPGDVAVLVPKNRQAREVQDALRAAGVAAVVSRSGDIRETDETADVEVVLHALARPDDAGALRAALATRLFGRTAVEIAGLEDGALDGLRRRFRRGQRTWRRHGVLRALTELAQDEGAAARLLAHPDGERRMTNLRHVVELLHDVEGAAARSPEDLLHWLRHRGEQALASRDKAELRLERDDEAVQVTTLHNAKGLEYEVVFLPLLWDVLREEKDWDRDPPRALDPLVHTGAGVVYDLGSDRLAEHRALREVERLAEALRLAYVGLTRAKERAYLTWGAFNEAHLSALGYLLAGHEAGGETDAEHVALARRTAQDADAVAALGALADAHPRLMEVTDLPAEAAALAPTAALAPAATEPRPLDDGARQRARDAWRRASFSGWTRAAARDDAGLAASDEADADTRDEAPPAGLHAFAAGTGPGTCLHAVLQDARWDEPDDDEDRRQVAEHNRDVIGQRLQAHGLDRPGRPHRAPMDPAAEVRALLGRVAAAPLFENAEGDPKRLADADHRAPEWSFAFPLGRVSPAALADAFREHGTEPFGAPYADALAALSRDAVDGLMVGEIDLVARVGGRWWVVDWKSNRLGGDAAAYVPGALSAAMAGHHYGLQLHLYTLGLHRFLRSRLPGYAYDAHVSGATYAFLRGLADPTDGAASRAGLFTHRPSAALVDALDRLLSPAGAPDA
jgi:exodeoxyribonuclease V beta subunit